MYWPGINKDIETLVKTCDICQENARRDNKDPSILQEVPVMPWSTLEMDLFTLDGYSFLLIVDITARFPVVWILNNETCKAVLNTLKGVYCDFGLPKKVLSDNGQCFKAEEFINFHEKLGNQD